MKIINDIHIGTARVGGTTPTSSYALRKWVIDRFGELLESVNEDLCILGDLFDGHTIPISDLLATYRLLDAWCYNNKPNKLILVRGNHDINTDSSKLSSFDALCELLEMGQDNVITVISPTRYKNCYILPHARNQVVFNEWLKGVPDTKFLLVHANYDNHFAKESDHSLNISNEQAAVCKAEFIVFAHEHQTRTMLDGKVVIVGNQIPTSIADCLGGAKFMASLTNKPELIAVDNGNVYEAFDWRNPSITDAKFVRFVGECSSAEAADMANCIARYRQTSDAFVVGNAVKIVDESRNELDLQFVSGFNVIDALKELLSEDHYKIVESVL